MHNKISDTMVLLYFFHSMPTNSFFVHAMSIICCYIVMIRTIKAGCDMYTNEPNHSHLDHSVQCTAARLSNLGETI